MHQLNAGTLLHAALDAAARGWHVFPLRPGSKQPALHGADRCRNTGDCSDGHRKWEQRATTDPRRIVPCWETGAANVAIATGPSGLVVVDLDVAKEKGSSGTPDGVTFFLALCERAGQPWPDTYTVRTPSGGMHLYFTAPPGTHLTNTAGKLAPLVDTRAWGGYVVAAGSLIDSAAYEVTAPWRVAELPAWLRGALAETPKSGAPSAIAPPRNASRRAQVALERERAAIEAAPEGKREETLFKAARSMGRFVAWGDIARHVVEEAFQVAGEAAGLKAYECRSTLRSALNWSIRTARPREAQ
ncbi:bifunctional DNA primase/polymerase-like protein [Streptomyces sp. Ag109_O5-1]|uniref:bifunctional DNA primase/polymerase n=1 Tax=Streptomyces sp. Ag109_O5-1 TaxID=1938851 RepID=UPI000F4F8766|nr:bifunctional DNA primase/polymerase [Streptomyces sp. Ag109_O5-1]RPE41955.1 bifunctional DNA primase/polymerase-like protein [Streptomyces sp. Ag109_O5-1]